MRGNRSNTGHLEPESKAGELETLALCDLIQAHPHQRDCVYNHYLRHQLLLLG